MDLSRIPSESWNKVLQAYVDTSAVLEVRVIKMKPDSYSIHVSDIDVVDLQTHWPKIERFDFRVQARMASGQAVDDVCGELRRWDNGTLGPKFDARLAWDERFIAWSSKVGEDDRHVVVLCGNVLSSEEAAIERLPMLYEWDRPDAPKDTEHRRWRFGRRSDEENAEFAAQLESIQTK